MDNINLSIEEKVGQKFIVGINSKNIDEIYNIIKKYKIGGVILYKKNYSNYQEMLEVVKKIKYSNRKNKVPLFIAIDQEWGKVNRMPKEIKNIKNMEDLLKIKDKYIVDDVSLVTSELLIKSGINMNLAPVLDLNNNSNNDVIYKRCFSSSPSEVSECGINYIKNSNMNRFLSVIKHYPGHGCTRRDTHMFLPYIYNYKSVLNKHIIPFNNVISSGCDAVMISHMIIRKLTKGKPASFSSTFINKYLRNNFNGLVITDDIKMKSINLLYGNNAIKKAFVSGSDIVLFKYKDGDCKYFDDIINMVKNEKISIKNIDTSVKRILQIKAKYNINDDTDIKGVDIEKINCKIDEINSRK